MHMAVVIPFQRYHPIEKCENIILKITIHYSAFSENANLEIPRKLFLFSFSPPDAIMGCLFPIPLMKTVYILVAAILMLPIPAMAFTSQA